MSSPSSDSSSVGIEYFQETSYRFLELVKESIREKIMDNEEYLDMTCMIAVNRLIDEILLDCVSDVHRAMKLGYTDMLFDKFQENHNSPSMFEVQKDECAMCPICKNDMQGNKFETHVEKCINKRRSSKLVRQRTIDSGESYYLGDDDDDIEERKTKKKKSNKNSEGKRRKVNGKGRRNPL